jgi:hypothetical protein
MSSQAVLLVGGCASKYLHHRLEKLKKIEGDEIQVIQSIEA